MDDSYLRTFFAASLACIEIKELYSDGEPIGQLKKVRFAQKVSALDSLAKYLGMFQDDGAVASAGLHIFLDLGEGAGEPNPAIDLRRTRAIGPGE